MAKPTSERCLTPQTAYVLKHLRKKGGWVTSRELGIVILSKKRGRERMSLDASCFWCEERDPPGSRKFQCICSAFPEKGCGLETRVSMRVAGSFRSLRRFGLIEQRIGVYEERGVMKARSEWRAR